MSLFDVLRPNVADEGTDPVDVVGETDNTEELDEDETDCFFLGGCCDIAEANCEHDVCSPVVGPDVLL